MTAVTAFGLASTALLAYLLFVARRNLVTVGDAHLQQWVDANTARWLYLGIAAVPVSAFIVAAALELRTTGISERRTGGPGFAGAQLGAVVGAIIGVLALVAGATATSLGLLNAPLLVAHFASLVGPLVVGGWAGRRFGRATAGALGGLWFGVLLALVSGFALVLTDTLFANRLASGPWLFDRVGDPTCNNRIGTTLAACEIGDTLGAMAFQWLLFPLYGVALGAVAALVGRATRGRIAARTERLSVLTSVGLCLVLILVLSVELSLHLW